jgi:membrane protein
VSALWRDSLPGRILGFAIFAVRRFMKDGCLVIAASLSYSTLLSLVPLLAVALALVSLVPQFDAVRVKLQDAIFENFLPAAGQEVQQQVTLFVENAQAITGVGFLVLLAAAYVVLSNVISAFNQIWHVAVPRSFLSGVSLKWLILLMGPILVGFSIYLSSYAFAMVEWVGLESYADSFYLTRLLPFFTGTIAFAVLYLLLPARGVRLLDAIQGAIVAGVLFEILKRGFGIYLRYFASYEAIYGALAAIPVLLVWTYLMWVVVLLGAEITAALPEWRVGGRAGGSGQGPAARIALAFTVVERLDRARARQASGLKERVLLSGLPVEPGQLSEALSCLRQAGLVRRKRGRWLLTKRTGEISLADLVEANGLSWDHQEDWPESARQAVRLWTADPEGAKNMPLEKLF